MYQFQKNIRINEVKIADVMEINPLVISRGDYELAYFNMAKCLEAHFDNSLLRWRIGERPVPDMEKALLLAEELLDIAVTWNLSRNIIYDNSSTWILVRYIAYLLGREAAHPEGIDDHLRLHEARLFDLSLDWRLLNQLCSQTSSTGDISFCVTSHSKRRKLATVSYETYFEILRESDDVRQTELVEIAETNYESRKADSYYDGGPSYMGGGPDNPYVVDFILASTLKKVGWAGESIHRWRW